LELCKHRDGSKKELGMDWEKINRVEVIDNNGRQLVRHDVTELTFDLQDDGKTLKMFIKYTPDEEIMID
tara:strand:+ start:24 stop:230 length:207 start_codon:yes stop_codon:yes gene_type:complete